MRFFMTIVLKPEQEGMSTPPQLADAMGPYIEKHVATGALISTAGLKRTGEGGARITGHAGRTSIVDGPFTEAKELVGGYAVLETPSRAAALAIADEFVQLHIDNGWPDIVVEIREIDGGYNC